MADTKITIKRLQFYADGNGNRTLSSKVANEAIQTIRELQEQIPKWHLCSDEYPKESGYYLVNYHEWSDGNFLPKYDDTRVKTMHFQNSDNYVGWNYPICCDERAEKDTHKEVIAWCELPKFEGVE